VFVASLRTVTDNVVLMKLQMSTHCVFNRLPKSFGFVFGPGQHLDTSTDVADNGGNGVTESASNLRVI